MFSFVAVFYVLSSSFKFRYKQIKLKDGVIYYSVAYHTNSVWELLNFMNNPVMDIIDECMSNIEDNVSLYKDGNIFGLYF